MVPSPDSASPPSVGGAAAGSASAIAADLLPILTIWNESVIVFWHYIGKIIMIENIATEWMKRMSVCVCFYKSEIKIIDKSDDMDFIQTRIVTDQTE